MNILCFALIFGIMAFQCNIFQMRPTLNLRIQFLFFFHPLVLHRNFRSFFVERHLAAELGTKFYRQLIFEKLSFSAFYLKSQAVCWMEGKPLKKPRRRRIWKRRSRHFHFHSELFWIYWIDICLWQIVSSLEQFYKTNDTILLIHRL